MNKYTFRFPYEDENKFREVLSRLDESEYNVIEDIKSVDEKVRHADRQTIIEMDAEAALTFRLGMKTLKIERSRSEEEATKEKERKDRHIIRVNVHIPTDDT